MSQYKLMKKHKLDKLSVDDLKALSSELSEYIESKSVDTAREAIDAVLAAQGLSIDQVYKGMTATPHKKPAPKQPTKKPTIKTKKKKETRGAASEAPKYRNPDNPEQTWSKGGTAKWVLAICEERGITKQDFMASAEFLNPEHPNYEEFKKSLEK